MGEVIQKVEHAVLAGDSDHRNRGISGWEEKVSLQSKHLRGVGIDHATVGKGDDAFPHVVAGNFVECVDDTIAKLFGGFTVGYVVPMACFTRDTHDIGLPLFEGLRQDREVFSMLW